MSLENFKTEIVGLVIIVLLLGAFAIALDSFENDLDVSHTCECSNAVWNESYSWGAQCRNETTSTSSVLCGESAAYNATHEGLEGTANATSYLSTIGTLIGVAALIAIVIGAFMYIRSK